ncbi:MAG TPA: hypothetical protein VE685_15535 [Thermoanaerobaculia bacterium]|nr:hypothetical protein [Thermoanaerobaculia bacterium]
MARHPWEITLRDFIEKVWRNYGIEIELVSATVVGSWFLKREDGWFYPLAMMDPDEILTISLLEHLCWFYGIPPEDFGLAPSL